MTPALLNLWFALNVALLFTHELDAVRHSEWRIFPGLKRLNDADGYRAFALVHIPLFALIVWAAPWRGFQVVFNVFLALHVLLHLAVSRSDPQDDFGGTLSRALIVVAGASGVAHLLALWALAAR